jgi:molybdate transport system substrate-binding protein
MKTLMRTLAFVAAVTAATSAARAADVKVFCTNGVKAVVEELLPQFEKTTGNKVAISYEPSTQIKKRIDAGETFDVAFMTTTLIDEAIKAGKLQFESRRFVARSGLGLSIRAGAKKPDIGSVDAFRKTLLAAKSITYATQGASAAPFEALVGKLGIESQVKPKYNLRNTAAQVGEAVASGAVEIGVAPVSEILPVKGVDLVGPFPKDVQSYVEITAAASTSAKEKDAANKLIAFIVSPSNAAVIKAKGMER